MQHWPRETLIKAAVVVIVAVAALAMFVAGQDKGDDRPVISVAPTATATPVPPPVQLPAP